MEPEPELTVLNVVRVEKHIRADALIRTVEAVHAVLMCFSEYGYSFDEK